MQYILDERQLLALDWKKVKIRSEECLLIKNRLSRNWKWTLPKYNTTKEKNKKCNQSLSWKSYQTLVAILWCYHNILRSSNQRNIITDKKSLKFVQNIFKSMIHFYRIFHFYMPLYWGWTFYKMNLIKASICYSFFQLLFGCPTTNFGLLSSGQPHSPDVNHCGFFYISDPKVTRNIITRLGP